MYLGPFWLVLDVSNMFFGVLASLGQLAGQLGGQLASQLAGQLVGQLGGQVERPEPGPGSREML